MLICKQIYINLRTKVEKIAFLGETSYITSYYEFFIEEIY